MSSFEADMERLRTDPGVSAEELPAIKRGIIAATEAATVEWPAGIPDGQWETVSVHTLELPGNWPPGCRCVLADGERVSLSGPCPVLHWHHGPTATDPDRGKMWCDDCGGEVSALEGVYVCSCGRQAE